MGHVEDQDHVLASGSVAKEIWRHVSVNVFILFGSSCSWKETVEVWFRWASYASQKGTLLGLVPPIVMWAWIWRCRARIEGRMDSVESFWRSIKAAIAWMEIHLKSGRKFQMGDVEILDAFSIRIKVTNHKRVSLVHWHKPALGWHKLNVDGCCLGNPGRMGAGGVIRDDEGRLTLAFSASLGHGTNNSAELMAHLFGLRHCRAIGIRKVKVELDTLLVVTWLQRNRCGIWYLEDYLEEIQELLSSLEFVVWHVYRVSNAATDFLAHMVSNLDSRTWSRFVDLSHLLKGILKEDRLGLPSLRYMK